LQPFVLCIEGSVMERFILIPGAAIAAVLAVTSPASADPYSQRSSHANLGGGLIELLVTGRDPGSRPAARQPQSQPPQGYVPQGQGVPYGAAPSYQALPMDPYARAPASRNATPPFRQAALDPDFRQVERGLDPKFLPQVVAYAGRHAPGTLVVDTTDKFLYLVEDDGKARRYGIGVGRPGFEWKGVKSITRKAEWPDWRPPDDMLKRRPDLPRFMAGGPENPMGARGLYLGSSLYRIHGTNEPHTIGQAVSSGCFRMRNEDVTDLYDRVRIGAKVVVM
jgi:lipoprotein-anchoring transpeptidase ErfK/SrfK